MDKVIALDDSLPETPTKSAPLSKHILKLSQLVRQIF